MNRNLVNVCVKDIIHSNGPKPSSREQFAMCNMNGKYYVFGGMS